MPNRRPNVLFIFTDEQRADTMAAYGNRAIHAPHLNALARTSFVFENAYVSQPVCTPSRTTIMTGLYPHTAGCTSNSVPLPSETKTLAEMTSPEYRTGYFGKWHLGDELRPQHGFSEWCSIEDVYRNRYSDQTDMEAYSDYHNFLVSKGMSPAREVKGGRVFDRISATGVSEEYTKAAFLGERAADFITRNRDNPFILYVNFLEPHPPFNGPFNGLHDRNDLNTGPAFLKQPAQDTSLLHRMMAEHYSHSEELGFDLTKEASWRELRARYFGLVTLIDKAVGRILKALDDSGQAENTIIVFTSEHGDMMGDHNILHKTVLYEEAMKVPLLIRVPWLRKSGKTVPGRVGLVDLVPTLLTLLGENVPGHLQGKSLAPVMSGASTLEDNDVFVQWNGTNGRKWSKEFHPSVPAATAKAVAGMPWRTIISHEGWKLSLADGDQCELYDLNRDHHELVNRFADPAQRDRIRDLAGRIRTWQSETDDRTPVHPVGL